jgi:UvrD-like helicase C-terminal domain
MNAWRSRIDGCIPSDMAAGSEEQIEEERRLLYVAMTRARHTSISFSPCGCSRAISTATVMGTFWRPVVALFKTGFKSFSSAEPTARRHTASAGRPHRRNALMSPLGCEVCGIRWSAGSFRRR